MKSARAAGFTLIELLIVVGIIGLLAAALLPDLLAGKDTANIEADAANMRQQYQWFLMGQSKAKLGRLPSEGGHKFLLALWSKQLIEATPKNFDCFWTPGIRENDENYVRLRKQVAANEKIWADLAQTTPEDTQYAARGVKDRRSMESGNEAWVANDNDGGWAFRTPVVNVLWGDGSVGPVNLEKMQELQPGFDKDKDVFKSYGPDSPHPALQKLEN